MSVSLTVAAFDIIWSKMTKSNMCQSYFIRKVEKSTYFTAPVLSQSLVPIAQLKGHTKGSVKTCWTATADLQQIKQHCEYVMVLSLPAELNTDFFCS